MPAQLLQVGCPFTIAFVMTVSACAADLDRAKLTKQLIKHEGKRTKTYLDTEGIPTVAVGFNLNRPDAKKKLEALGLNYAMVRAGDQELNEQQIAQLLTADIDAAVLGCKAVFPKFSELSDVRQRVLADMMFNLGKTRLETFKRMIGAVNNNDFGKAADEMKDSKWYRQVKRRAETLEKMMRTDRDPD